MHFNIVDCIKWSDEGKREGNGEIRSFLGSGDIAHWTWTSNSPSFLLYSILSYFYSTYDYSVLRTECRLRSTADHYVVFASIPATPKPTRPLIPASNLVRVQHTERTNRPHGYLTDVSPSYYSFVTRVLFFFEIACVQFDLMYLRVEISTEANTRVSKELHACLGHFSLF